MNDPMTNIESKDLILVDLIHNQSHFVSIVKDLTDQLPELINKDPLFKEEIENNYISLVKSRFLQDITKRLTVNSEDALSILDNINLKEYLK